MDGRYLSDAAHFPGGHAAAIAVPRTTAEIPAIVRAALTLLPVGAQSSLTGGATPMGEIVLSTEKLARILDIGGGSIRVEAGVPIASIQHVLASHDAWFPPVPTFTGAFAGGTVATNAAGAATFRHGSVRPWVQALDVVLADGSELTIVRGEHTARDGRLRVPTTSGTIEETMMARPANRVRPRERCRMCPPRSIEIVRRRPSVGCAMVRRGLEERSPRRATIGAHPTDGRTAGQVQFLQVRTAVDPKCAAEG